MEIGRAFVPYEMLSKLQSANRAEHKCRLLVFTLGFEMLADRNPVRRRATMFCTAECSITGASNYWYESAHLEEVLPPLSRGNAETLVAAMVLHMTLVTFPD